MNSSATTTVSYEVTGFSEGTLSIVETRKTESTISSDYGGVTTGTGTIRNIIHIPLSVLSAQVKVVPADQPVNRSMGSVTGTDTFNGYKVEIVASDPSTAGIPTDEYRSTDSTGEGKPDRSVVAKWDFPVADEGVANQIAKALKHAIELSGGKKDLFDSSTPP
jgi:hypothetical protein